MDLAFSTQLPKSVPMASIPADMSWYTPNLTSIPTATLTQDLSWSLEPEPLPEVASKKH